MPFWGASAVAEHEARDETERVYHDIRLLPALSARHRVLVPDLLGFGYSDKSDRFDRSEAIAAWLRHIGIERAAVVGHDIGGGVALRLATLHAAAVARLCVINTVCYDSWPVEVMLQFGHPEADRKLSAATATTLLREAVKQGFASTPSGELLDGLLAP